MIRRRMTRNRRIANDFITTAVAFMLLCPPQDTVMTDMHIGEEVDEIIAVETADDTENVEEVEEIVTHVTLTCYQPTENQCNDDPLTTADGSKIDVEELKNGNIKWVAVSRDLLYLFPKGKPKRVLIDGYGEFEVHDTMNKRWNHRVDILVSPDETAMLREDDIKVTILG
ncbi:MAG: hypothetical protein LUD72_03315 [Bacteroidales bacterium]|nr:hypothetical protein [Bacteroidales bacterium]